MLSRLVKKACLCYDACDMDIIYLNKGSFKLSGKTVSVAVNPHKPIEADIAVHGETSLVEDMKKDIVGPGEYEVQEVSVFSCPGAYLIIIDEMNVLYITPEATATIEQLGTLGQADILLVPVAEKAEEYVKKSEATLVIPYGDKEEELTQFVTKLALTSETMNKLTVKPANLVGDDQKVIILTAK